MTSNSVYNKILKFAIKTEDINLSQFQDLLEKSRRNNTIKVEWETLEGNVDYYEMYWIPGPIATTPQGRKMSETKADEGMFNVRVVGLDGKWRTLDLQTVRKARFEKTLYYIK
jgi:hypothetical protein